jgi:Ribbon-helix-helix protein, copG family
MKNLSRQGGFYLSDALMKRVREKADMQERSLSEVIRNLLRLWVEGKIDG